MSTYQILTICLCVFIAMSVSFFYWIFKSSEKMTKKELRELFEIQS